MRYFKLKGVRTYMRIDFIRPDNWEQANQIAFQFFKFVNLVETQVFVTKGASSGLFETLFATTDFLSHKNTVALLKGQSWAERPIVKILSRKGLEVKTFSCQDLLDPEKVIEKLGDEVSCVFLVSDHPLTAEKFQYEKLEELLAKKRIVTTVLYHHELPCADIKIHPYSAHLYVIHDELSVALCGARYRTPNILVQDQFWDLFEVRTQLEARGQNLYENKTEILRFESALPNSFFAPLQNKNRVFDRAVVSTELFSGEDLQERLFEIFGVRALTLQLCQWNATMQDLSWWDCPLTPKQIRGSLIIPAQLLSEYDFISFFSKLK